MMFRSVSFPRCLNRRPWTRERIDHIVVCSKKKPPNNGYPGRGRRPRKKYSKNVGDDVDISLLYEASGITEIPRGFVVDCAKHINNCINKDNLKEAQEVFDLMIEKRLYPDVVTYTTLMKGYSGVGDNQKVYNLFRDMEKNGVRPNEKTFSTIIRACANTGDLQRALILLDKMKNRYWMAPNVITYSSVLNVCASAKDLETAKKTFAEMLSSSLRIDVVVFTTMIDVYAECSNKGNGRQYLNECRYLLEEMDVAGVKANTTTLNTLLKLCARGSLTKEAMAFLNEMRAMNVHPNEFSYSTIIDGISKDEELSNDKVLELSARLVGEMKEKEVKLGCSLYNSLINIALRIKDLKRAINVFNEMKKLNVRPTSITYGAMIKCYEKLGDSSTGDAYLKPCLDLTNECKQSGLKLDLVGRTSLLTACANVANLKKALEIWRQMLEVKTKPNVFVFTAMISVCLRANEEEKAFEFLDKMNSFGVEPNEVTCGTFITYFIEKKHRLGALRAYNKMKSLGAKPDKEALRILKALRIS